MNKTRESLHSARESLDPILGRRRPTTEAELDECVAALEELKRGMPLGGNPAYAVVMSASFDEVISRIKNRRKGAPP